MGHPQNQPRMLGERAVHPGFSQWGAQGLRKLGSGSPPGLVVRWQGEGVWSACSCYSHPANVVLLSPS